MQLDNDQRLHGANPVVLWLHLATTCQWFGILVIGLPLPIKVESILRVGYLGVLVMECKLHQNISSLGAGNFIRFVCWCILKLEQCLPLRKPSKDVCWMKEWNELFNYYLIIQWDIYFTQDNFCYLELTDYFSYVLIYAVFIQTIGCRLESWYSKLWVLR